MLLDGKMINIKINSTYTDKVKNKALYRSKKPIKIIPFSRIVRAFLNSKQIKGTIHRICIEYIK